VERDFFDLRIGFRPIDQVGQKGFAETFALVAFVYRDCQIDDVCDGLEFHGVQEGVADDLAGGFDHDVFAGWAGGQGGDLFAERVVLQLIGVGDQASWSWRFLVRLRRGEERLRLGRRGL
jgi:hypothetical protein